MVVAVLAMLLGTASPVKAEPSESPSFKALFTKAERFYAAGELTKALPLFKQADALRPTAEVAYDLALTYQRLKDQAHAAYYFRLYLKRAPGARDALEVAELLGDALAQAESEGRGLLTVETDAKATVEVTGRVFQELPLATFLPPGDYTVVARFDSGLASELASLRTGKVTALVLDAPRALKVAPASSPELAPRPKPEASAGLERALHPSSVPSGARPLLFKGSVALTGASTVALIVGTVLGALSNNEVRAEQAVHGQIDLPEHQRRLASINSKRAAANILWGAGGAGAALGVTGMLLTWPGETSRP